jgi:hypothetical protein
MLRNFILLLGFAAASVINATVSYADELEDILLDMPYNSWAKINQNEFSEVWTPLEQRPTSWSPGSNISGYSGAAWGDGKIWIYGGNIGQEYGNEVYTFDTATFMWNRLSLPSETQGNGSSEADAYPVDGLDNAPRSGESWDNLAYLHNQNKFAVIDVSFNGSGLGTGPYIFDPAKADPNKVGGTENSHVNPSVFTDVVGGQMWENRDFTRSDQPVGAAGAYASIDGEDVVFYSNGGRNYDLWKWVPSPIDASEDTWTKIGLRNGTEIGFAQPGPGTFAPARNIFIRKSEKNLIYWDVDAGGLANIVEPKVIGSDSFPSDETWGIDYDNENDVFYLWNGRRKIWKLKPPVNLSSGDWNATLLTPSGTAPSASNQPGVFGKWYYMPKYGAFIGVADDEGNVHVYKPAPKAPDALPTLPPTGPDINFNDYTVGVYAANEDIEGVVTIEDDGATLSITGNTWRQINFPYDITSETILQFDFTSSSQGEAHAIGFDDDLSQNRIFAFQLYGTENWGIQDANVYSGEGSSQRIVIPIGQFYTGPREYLFFVMNHDVSNPQAESRFSNVNVYEPILVAPEFVSTPNLYSIFGKPYFYDEDSFLQASGTAPISYSLLSGPDGMDVNSEGFVTWVPSEGQDGDHPIEILAENAAGSSSQQFVITVSLDTDGDGMPNTCGSGCLALGMTEDLDDDNDGIPDTYEVSYGLNPLDASDGALDGDDDTLSNLIEFGFGTNPNDDDSDEDGITDNIDNHPSVSDTIDPTLYSGQLVVLSDMTADGVTELGVLSVNPELLEVTLDVLDGKTLESIRVIVWSDIYSDQTIAIHLIEDLNGNGVSEVGLYGVRDSANNEGKPQMFVRDLATGVRVNVFNWPANWKQAHAVVLKDMTNDGIAEIALQGRFKEGFRPQLVVKSGSNTATIDTFSYPNLFIEPQFFQHSDINDDGVGEISTFGRIARNNKIQVKLASGMDSKDRLKAYNFPDKWDDVSWIKLDDSNGDDIPDWGLFGTNKQDGRPQLIVKDGTDPKGALRLHAWPSAILSAKFFVIPDMNGDGVDEVAAAGLRTNGRHQFQIQDGVDRNSVLVNYNLNLNLQNVSYHVLPDMTNDGVAEIGFMGVNNAGDYELNIRDGNIANGQLKAENLGSDWLQSPSITSLADTDGDGVPNLLISGQKSSSNSLVIVPI